jgi:hypothetical protein
MSVAVVLLNVGCHQLGLIVDVPSGAESRESAKVPSWRVFDRRSRQAVRQKVKNGSDARIVLRYGVSDVGRRERVSKVIALRKRRADLLILQIARLAELSPFL